LVATAVFACINIGNAESFSPQWSQDLSFFHQIVHSAATGGPWSSPLILEPQGFWEMVHTHLAMPLVVSAYKIAPFQETLLVLHSFAVCLSLWPAYRLGESLAGGRHAILCVFAILAFGPFQAVAIADFRPSVLFIPGILGIWASAWRGSWLGLISWSLVAIAGRQDATYLVGCCGFALMLLPWGRSKRTQGAALILMAASFWLLFWWLKPAMFFHINPSASAVWPTSTELWDNRLTFGLSILVSAWWLGLRSPAALFAAIPVFWGMLSTDREWHILGGPGAHHHAFWLPFVIASGIAGSRFVPKGFGPLLLFAGSAMSFPWVTQKSESNSLQILVEQVPASARVAADYDSIHRLAGRQTLWNIEQMYMEDRPRHWNTKWPITEKDVDWVLMPSDHRLSEHLSHWKIVDSVDGHILLRR
jgi:hypothetical protein